MNFRECEIQYYFYNPANHEENDKLDWPDLTQESYILDGCRFSIIEIGMSHNISLSIVLMFTI